MENKKTRQVAAAFGIVLMLLAINVYCGQQCNASGSTSTSLNLPLSNDDLQYGESQIQLMLHDCPAMAPWVEKGEPVYLWTERQFAGESVGARVSWTKPSKTDEVRKMGYLSYHHRATEQRPAEITVFQKDSKNVPLSGDRIWAYVIFELFNLSNDALFDKAWRDAAKGVMSEELYVNTCAELEYKAFKRERAFYLDVWLPLVKKRGLDTSGSASYWGANLPPSFDLWMAQHTDHSLYPWDIYGKYYGEARDFSR